MSLFQAQDELALEELVPPMLETPLQAEQDAPAEVVATDGPERRELPPTATPIILTDEDDPRAALDLAQPDYRDGFDNPDTWFDYDTPGQAAYLIDGGQLTGTDYEPEDFNTWWTYVERQSGNTYAEITATNGDCIAKDSVGFVIRVDEETAAGGYGVEVSCDGNYRFMLYRRGQQAQEMQAWTESDAINTGPGASNRIGLWGYANEFFVFINNELVHRQIDSSNQYTFGTFAVYVRAHQTFDLTAVFDDFAFWHIRFLAE